eukprot:106702_1
MAQERTQFVTVFDPINEVIFAFGGRGNGDPNSECLASVEFSAGGSMGICYTITPTMDPTMDPTMEPTVNPTNNPSINPTNNPSINPTKVPTNIPTTNPTGEPTYYPTIIPSFIPTYYPTYYPTGVPTTLPTELPTTTSTPSLNPTYDEYTIIISADIILDENDVENIVKDSLGITNDDVISTKNEHGSITLIVTIPNSFSLDEDSIKQHITQGLAEEYGDQVEIEVQVEKNDTSKISVPGFFDNLLTGVSKFILIIVLFVFLIIICLLCICLIKRSKIKKKAQTYKNKKESSSDNTGEHGTNTIEMQSVGINIDNVIKNEIVSQMSDDDHKMDDTNDLPSNDYNESDKENEELYDNNNNTNDLPFDDHNKIDEENEELYDNNNNNEYVGQHTTTGGDNNNKTMDVTNDIKEYDGVLVTPDLETNQSSAL